MPESSQTQMIWKVLTAFLYKTHQSYRSVLQWEFPRRTLDTEFKIALTHMIKEFKKFEENINEHFT